MKYLFLAIRTTICCIIWAVVILQTDSLPLPNQLGPNHSADNLNNHEDNLVLSARVSEHESGRDFSLNLSRWGVGKLVSASLFPPSAATISSSNKIAYLTFDDGPSKSTSRILDILEENGVKATFFVTGKTSDYSKQMLHQIVDQGHTLGNHTYSHDYNRIYASVGAFKADVDRLNRLLEETVGVKPNILRYPGGSNNHLSWRSGGRHIMSSITREMSALGYQYFDWNVSSTDAAAVTQSKDAIVESVKGNSSGKKQIIVLMHDMDVKTTTVEALPEIIAYLKQERYQFDVLGKDSFTFQFLRQGSS